MKRMIKLNKKKTAAGGFDKMWVIRIIFLTFFISAGFSFVSEVLLRNVEVLVAFIILIIIIMTGILFDILGVAVTAADETPFHSMSSRKMDGAKMSVYLIRNAGKVSNICNDVIGDICGVVSGAAGAVIAGKMLSMAESYEKTILAIGMSAIISALTVGGKAIGKHYAISRCNGIVYIVGYIIEKIKRLFKHDN